MAQNDESKSVELGILVYEQKGQRTDYRKDKEKCVRKMSVGVDGFGQHNAITLSCCGYGAYEKVG